MIPVTASTKCWEADYREILSAPGLDSLFEPLGAVSARQVVMNQIHDRGSAEALASRLVADGILDRWAWAEDLWPELSRSLGLPFRWFGRAWPYSAPEVCELSIAGTPLVAHVAGDVRIHAGGPWLERASQLLATIPHVAAVAPLPPAGADSLRAAGGADRPGGWIETGRFSDQCFVVRKADLLDGKVLRSAGKATSAFPKPGGALTFEARVAAWMASEGRTLWVDTATWYEHPIRGDEGATYTEPFQEPPGVLPRAGGGYPATASVDARGLVIVTDGNRYTGESASSLGWCREVVVVAPRAGVAVERARDAGAEVRVGPLGPMRRQAVAEVGSGWLVTLDADEVCPPSLAVTLAGLMSEEPLDGVRVPRMNHAFGQWIRLAGLWPDRQVKVTRMEHAVVPATIDRPITLPPWARVLDLPARPDSAIVRFSYAGLDDWVERTNRATSWEAARASLPGNVGTRVALRALVDSYVRDGGFRLGRVGVRIGLLTAVRQLMLVEKWAELVSGGATAVLAEYDEIAAKVLEGRWDVTPTAPTGPARRPWWRPGAGANPE